MIEVLIGAGLGLISGYIVAIIAKEELIAGKKYFLLLQGLFLTLMGILISYLFTSIQSYITLAIFLTFILLFVITKNHFNIFLKEGLFLLGIIIFSLNIKDNVHLLILSSILFFYSLLAGTLIYLKVNILKINTK